MLLSLLLIHSGKTKCTVGLYMTVAEMKLDSIWSVYNSSQTNASDILVPCRLCSLEDCVCVCLAALYNISDEERQTGAVSSETRAHKEFLCFFPGVWLVPTARDVIRKIPLHAHFLPVLLPSHFSQSSGHIRMELLWHHPFPHTPIGWLVERSGWLLQPTVRN